MEEQFKKKLSTVKVDWDKEKLWQELEPKLPVKKRKYHRLWFLFFLLAGLGSGLFFYAEPTPLIGCLPLGVEQKHATTAFESEAINFIEDTSTYIVKPELPSRKPSSRVSGQLREEATSAVGGPKGIKDQVEHSNDDWPLKTRNLESGEQKLVEIEFIPKAVQADFTTVPNALEATNWKLGTGKIEKNKDALSLPFSKDVFPVLPTLWSGVWLPGLTSDQGILPEPQFVSEPIRQKYAGIFLELTAGAGTSSRSVNFDVEDEELLATLKGNKAAEKTIFSLGADFGVGYQLKSGLFVRSGLNYRMIHEQLDWENTTNDNSGTLINSERAFYQLTGGGDTLFYSGEVRGQLIEKRKVFHNNHISIYSIPVEAGFEKRFGKFYLSGYARMNITVFSSFQGRVINIENEVIDNPKINLYSKVGYHLGAGVGYQINRTLSVYLNGSFERSPTILINSAKQSYQSFNAQLGIKRFLGR